MKPTRTLLDPEGWVDGLVEGRRGELVHEKSQRSVWRVEEDGTVWYVKRGIGPKRRELRREARNLSRMAAGGVAVPRVLDDGDHRRATWLVTSPAPGRPLLEDLTEVAGTGDLVRARTLMDAAAVTVRALHDRSWTFPDLTASHLYVHCDETGHWQGTLLDVTRAEQSRTLLLPDRARDLAAFLFSLPFGATSRHLRLRFIEAATGFRGAPLEMLLPQVDSALDRLRMQTRWRHKHAGAAADVREALSELRGNGTEDGPPLYDQLLDAEGMEVLRTLPDRENRSFGRRPDGSARFFMKVYPPVRGGLSPAMRERDAIDLFGRSGVPVCSAVAYGEDVESGSFLAVRACDGVPLDDLLREGVTTDERRALAEETGRIWGRMRKCGLRHRDAYACHVFAAREDGAPGGFSLRIIDLTRGGPAPFPRERWFVKDAAQLWHGVPRDAVTRTDAVRWLRAYFGIDRLDPRAKRFARRVAAKERRIAERQKRKAAAARP